MYRPASVMSCACYSIASSKIANIIIAASAEIVKATRLLAGPESESRTELKHDSAYFIVILPVRSLPIFSQLIGAPNPTYLHVK